MKTIFGAFALLGLVGTAIAQGYPNRPVRVLVPFPPGSAPDQVARIVGMQMQETLGQPFVVENKPGAQGSIASTEVARSAPDGYTLLVPTNTTHAANPSLFKKLAYDPMKDFTHVGRLSMTSLMLVVKPEFPAQSTREFLEYARARPGKLSGGYGSGGTQLSIALLKSLGGVDVLAVPYKGVPQAVADLLAGQLDLSFADLAVGLVQVKAGKLKGLGVTSKTRTPLAPDLPALAEEMPGFDITVWYGLVAPAGTPREIVVKLWDAALKGITKPETRSRLASLSLDVAPLGPDEFVEFNKVEIAKWAKQIQDAGIQPE